MSGYINNAYLYHINIIYIRVWPGVLPVLKPAGMTSGAISQSLAQLAKKLDKRGYEAKVGHAGTLDPMATGVGKTSM